LFERSPALAGRSPPEAGAARTMKIKTSEKALGFAGRRPPPAALTQLNGFSEVSTLSFRPALSLIPQKEPGSNNRIYQQSQDIVVNRNDSHRKIILSIGNSKEVRFRFDFEKDGSY
jgi:hypothetical protein